ncbi:hypothetical protein, partial [Lentzea pudingi]|uniref:hypothetical protein n=1 Tax=Lentzea pudingi TaxID=1789439 RepID=UPI001E5E0894
MDVGVGVLGEHHHIITAITVEITTQRRLAIRREEIMPLRLDLPRKTRTSRRTDINISRRIIRER